MVQLIQSPDPAVVDDLAQLIDVDEARKRILSAFAPLPGIDLPIGASLGLVLTEDVLAVADLPPFANAAMDGFAVRVADTLGARRDAPLSLRVIGEAPAGHPTHLSVECGTAVRIMTGAPVPTGADAVVRFEETDESLGLGSIEGAGATTIGIFRSARDGENIRPRGEDIRAGSTALTAGTRLRPAEIGVLAALGRGTVSVYRRPRVAILATGDEIVGTGVAPQPGQIWDSNSAMVAALVQRYGGEPLVLGIARDTVDAVQAKLWEADGTDLLVTTGGVSVGDYDVVKHVLRREGRVELWQVRLKPGKPLAFGWIGDRPLIGLPGNPVAAAIAFEQFVRPALLTMMGRTDLAFPTVIARLTERVENRGGRRHFVRVRVETREEGYIARLAGPQGAGILTSLLRANGLLIIPEAVASAEAGTCWTVQMLDWNVA